ncbi:hypothetical protein IJJ36_02665 [Candidatus Saccharibacteria bacterium]|nr:hypothetical protein [Candidatus Saccharibacteria bacterium]
MAREINLVPDVKGEMIKALKLRNFILFLCIVIASASVAVSVIFAVIASGQQAVVDGKKNTLDTLSKKINSYSDLSDFLTVKDQLGNLASISDNKKLLSRTFNILPALLPTGANTITVSELNIDLSADEPTISFDAQANAGEPPYIDYAVLESFKKSMDYMRYDYGDYVDKEGSVIPAYCIIESGADGATFYDRAKSSYYAFWLITGDGCNPAYKTEGAEETEDNSNKKVSAAELSKRSEGYTTEDYNGQTVVRIWRTPQYNDWYKDTETEGEPYMGLNGSISNVAHFESKCVTYSGSKNSNTNNITWSSSNDSCLLVPGGADNGIKISNSSNGRGSNDELVLRFSATIMFAPEFYKFSNHHMLAVGPTGRHNVTDSYVQIQNMFEQRASDCSEDDTACNNNTNGGN